MPRKISDETREEIIRLYDNGSGLSPAEIARRAKVSYKTAYEYAKLRQKINPKTGGPFESLNQYREYTARQRTNPETGELFESRNQSDEYTARQRQERPENQRLSNLIKKKLKDLGKTQSWLAREMGITRSAVSLYVKCRNVPPKDPLQQLYSSLEVPYKTLDDLL